MESRAQGLIDIYSPTYVHGDFDRSVVANTAAWDLYRSYVVHSWNSRTRNAQILAGLKQLGFDAPASELAIWLCRWGLFALDLHTQYWLGVSDAERENLYRIAVRLANQATDAQMRKLWDDGITSFQDFTAFDFNLLAYYHCGQASNHLTGVRPQRITATSSLILSNNNFAKVLSALPRQPDRKVCMTCGGHTDGVIYCSEQCRPSAALEWYSHTTDRAETPTMTEGFRTARSRFLTPSAASQATFDSSQFVPPPYGLEDANPPTPRFVPTKEETLDEEDLKQDVANLEFPARNPYLSGQARLPSIHSILNDSPRGPDTSMMAPFVAPDIRLQNSFWTGALFLSARKSASYSHTQPLSVERSGDLQRFEITVAGSGGPTNA